VFITSTASTTPFHFDPEIGFCSLIEGEKIYHVYSPSALRETVLEKFYLQGQTSIGQVELKGCDPALDEVIAAMRMLIPVRKRVGAALKAMRGNQLPQHRMPLALGAAHRQVIHSAGVTATSHRK
jgi:hypothetical protein